MNPYAHIPKNFDTLEDGGWYMDRGGNIVQVTHHPNNAEELSFRTTRGVYLGPNGNCWPRVNTIDDLTHRVNPDGSLWTGEAEATQTSQAGRIHIRNITLEAAQTLPSGEEQTIIVEHDGDTATVSTENWTEQTTTIAHVAEAATEALATARIRIRVLQLENKQ